jgi:GMP synthase-like glutamine amidotransferase
VDVLALVHGADGGLSLFEEVAEGLDGRIVEVRLDRGERPERPPGGYGAVFAMGGTAHPHEEEAHPWIAFEIEYLKEAVDDEVPTLGVCLGAELMTHAAGGRVEPSPEPEIGWFPVELAAAASADPVFSTLPDRFTAFQWHEYSAGLPPGGVELARNGAGAQAFRLGEAAWGVQFHPEVRHDQLVRWIRVYGDDPPTPPEAFMAGAERHIGAWNEIGRTLCTRFLTVAADRGGR